MQLSTQINQSSIISKEYCNLFDEPESSLETVIGATPVLASANEESEPKGLKSETQFEALSFHEMQKSALSMLLVFVDEPCLIEPLKAIVLDIEEEQRKYLPSQKPNVSGLDLGLLSAIDALEMMMYLADEAQIEDKRNRLKRRLAEWSPASYLVNNNVRKFLDSAEVVALDETLIKRLKKAVFRFTFYRNRIAQANLRLVYSVANRFRHLGLSYEDLVQEGNLGLIKAIERFDISKGFRFSTYAHIVISQSIHLAIDKQASLVRLPFKALREKAAVEKVRQNLEQSLGRSPTIHELNLHLSDDLEYKSNHISRAVEPNANSQKVYASPEDAELIEEMSPYDQDAKTSSLSHADLVKRSLARLDDRESYIIRMRFGIGLSKEYTLEEISQTIGLSRERIRQLSQHALEKLSKSFNHGL